MGNSPQYSSDPANVQPQGQVPAAQAPPQGQVPAEQAPMPPPPPYRLVPEKGSRLEQLRSSLEAARAAVAAAREREKAIADGIKFEAVSQAPPGTSSVIIAGGPGVPDWLCHYVESWRLDTQAMKEQAPLTYVRWAKKGGTWKIEKARG